MSKTKTTVDENGSRVKPIDQHSIKAPNMQLINPENIKTIEDVKVIFEALQMKINIDDPAPHIQRAVYLTK